MRALISLHNKTRLLTRKAMYLVLICGDTIVYLAKRLRNASELRVKVIVCINNFGRSLSLLSFFHYPI